MIDVARRSGAPLTARISSRSPHDALVVPLLELLESAATWFT